MQPPSNATVRARHILVNDEDKAVALLKELAFGAEIEELAAEHSLCPSRAKGGDLGVFRRGDMAEEFEAFVFDESSPIGTPLGPVRTPFGYHVVVIDERDLQGTAGNGDSDADGLDSISRVTTLSSPAQSEGDTDTARDGHEDGDGARPVTGAALAAASWGAWRMQPPSNATVRARHILVNDEDKAVALLKELAFGAEIEELAAEHSLCPSRAKGGDLGVFRRGDMAEEFEAFVFDESSPIGTPLGPVRTPFGYHVVVIDERTTSHDDDRLS